MSVHTSSPSVCIGVSSTVSIAGGFWSWYRGRAAASAGGFCAHVMRYSSVSNPSECDSSCDLFVNRSGCTWCRCTVGKSR